MAATLHQAVFNQDIELAQSLLDSGVDPNDRSVIEGLLSTIQLAVKICHKNILQPPAVRLNMVKLLITHPCRPANPNLPDITNAFRCQVSNNLPFDHIFIGCNALIHFAIHHDDYDLALLLVTESRIKVDVDILGYDCHRPLLRAIEKKNYKMVKLLLDAGANVYRPSNHSSVQWTPFMFAVKEKKDLQMCKLLIDSGYDVNKPILDKYCSAVHLAVENDITILKYLLETCGADVFAEPQTNRRMLGVVINLGKAHTLESLLHHCYQQRGNEIWWSGDNILHHAAHNPVCTTVLLRWGLNNAVGKIRVLDISCILKSLYRISYGMSSPADPGSYIKVMKLLKQMYPQYLQERKFIESRTHLNSYSQEVQKFLMELYKERKNPSRLTILCRTKIFQLLGYNPIHKAEQLPLPRPLINFVQFKYVKDLYIV